MMNDWKPYRPSNGSEGEVFMESWCYRCKRDQAFQENPDQADGCELIAATYAYDVDHPKYPKEWVMRWFKADDGIDTYEAKCTAFEPTGPERCKHTGDMFKDAAPQAGNGKGAPDAPAAVAALPLYTEVTQPNGEPVPAPCAISGCHYEKIEKHNAECERLCDNRKSCGYDRYAAHMSCTHCPKDWMIV